MKIDQINSIFYKIAIWSSGMILLFIPLFIIKDIYETRQLLARNPEVHNEWGAMLYFIAVFVFFYYLTFWGLTLGIKKITDHSTLKVILLFIMLTFILGPILYLSIIIIQTN